ncbi:hypothetical protein EDB81DRAFT_869328 [Dactylonectria macrodidyma]|uniref:Zn(2)-C6 fungal-type domain-containing protein n=1 Tax=Dactylonectria macrodidyma TaxID=307937 RepID=A0A9P9ET55_9HYPO|nr:hypothetical protein EDB81DRAFT_869328 [Dactylonectria macrodidyma]
MASPTRDTSTHRAAISRPSSTYTRKRGIKACQVCRARRTKCDQKRPSCSFCVKAGVECVFEPDANATFDQASLAIIDRLDRLERKIDAQSANRKGQDGSPSTDNLSLCTSPSAPIPSREGLFPVNLDGVLNWPVFQGLTSPTATASSPYSSRSYAQPHSQQSAWLGHELDPATCDRWLDNFFAHVHVKNPILDEAGTRRLVRRLCVQGAEWNISSGLALLVCANGALARPLHESLPLSDPDMQTAVALFDTAQRRLGTGLVSQGLVQAQCAFLSGVLLMSLLRPIEAWTTFVHGLAICQTLPSIRQRQPEMDQRTSAQFVAEQSVYWSCWKSEQELRFELGMSRTIGPADDPPQLFPDPPEGCQGHIERAWYFYLSEISLWRLEVDARRSIGQVEHNYRESLSQTLSELGHSTLGQLDAWRDSLPPLVDIGNASAGMFNEDDVVRFVLRGRVTFVHELISWPFLFAAINDAPTHVDGETWVANALAFHHNRLLVNTPGFYHRHHGTWLMLRSSARSACILLGFAYLYPGSTMMPVAWKDSVSNTAKMLEHWSTEVQEMRPVLETMKRLLGIFE